MSEKMTMDEFKRIIAPDKRKPKNDYKARFLRDLSSAGIPAPQTEHRFHPHRKWLMDFAYPELRLAIEYQGGNFGKGKKCPACGNHGKGGHSSIAGLMRDYEKFTEASLLGWTLILIDAASVRSGQAVEWVRRALQAKEA